MKKYFIFILFIAITYADVMYEMETRSEGVMALNAATATVRNFIKGDRMRTEIKSESPLLGHIEKTIITRLDKGILWILDNDKKEFFTEQLNGVILESPVDTIDIPPEIKVEEYEITKEILKILCKKYVISLDVKSDDGNMHITQTMWIGKDFPGYSEIMSFNRRLQENIIEFNVQGVDNRLLREFQKKVQNINGFPMELELNFNMGMEDTMMAIKTVSVVKKISTVPISDKVFEIPDGYRPKTELGID